MSAECPRLGTAARHPLAAGPCPAVVELSDRSNHPLYLTSNTPGWRCSARRGPAGFHPRYRRASTAGRLLHPRRAARCGRIGDWATVITAPGGIITKQPTTRGRQNRPRKLALLSPGNEDIHAVFVKSKKLLQEIRRVAAGVEVSQSTPSDWDLRKNFPPPPPVRRQGFVDVRRR